MMRTKPSPVKILIANDNRINRTILSKYLKQLGHDSEYVTNGEEAFEAYQNNPESYRWILMKPSMPVIDGMESTKLIREFEHGINLKRCGIIWLVASMLSLRRDLARDYAVTAIMQWPVRLNDFARMLNESGIPTALPEPALS
ncbi:response regulator receiver protein [Colletotrichum incanum]|uniref:Response regulator receiver protein n=1 Tax=Colletotrichum incanum TaxID=1573173 RepID=A0A166QPE9_COLIC|nr:response regulator receiver protein [Colletotrichum incanum]OHW99136.1 hsp90-like protein [Colletotrichum incanum]